MQASLHLDDDAGLWAEQCGPGVARGAAAIFLDRDGTLVEEVHFLQHADDVRMTSAVAEAVAAANAGGVAVVVVTNQSGIARGLYGWPAFAAVQQRIVSRLAEAGAHIDATLACGYHENGTPPYNLVGHPWRKPGAGMLLRAQEMLGCDLARSIVIGDRVSDLQAGVQAGVPAGSLVMTGYGKDQLETFRSAARQWERSGFAADIAPDAGIAIQRFLANPP